MDAKTLCHQNFSYGVISKTSAGVRLKRVVSGGCTWVARTSPQLCLPSEREAYQTTQTWSSGRTMGVPGLQEKALAKGAKFDSGPITRNLKYRKIKISCSA